MLDNMAKGVMPWVDDTQRSQWAGYFEYLVKRLNKELETGRYNYLLIDTIEPVEAGMTAAVEKGKKVYGWSGALAYGKKETEGVRPLYHGLFEAVSRRGIKDILVSSHLKQPWVQIADKKSIPVPGKVKPGGRLVVLSQLSTAMFWLVREMNPRGEPAAIVLKARTGKYEIVGDRWEARRVLPERIPAFSWSVVDRYREAPADFENPEPGEVMSEQELEMISEFLNTKQMELMVLSAKERIVRLQEGAGKREPKELNIGKGKQRGEEKPGPNLQQAKVLALASGGMEAGEIAKQEGLPVPVVLSWLK
jgi:hypothetical protein